ncbi:MAG: 30S ribosome-binding factor RbfA [Clostridiales bacterium]|nr:30S ribosome-binding factor RbfA [Clostridiales bacterium]MCD8225548.1 30S ribosome-binding factor RbfA [Clostridiales bacterium]
MRKNSVKNTRINMEVQRELSEIIRTQIKDPRVAGAMVSVTSAEVTPDLKYCKVHISTLGSDEAAAAAFEGLLRASGFIRRELARRVNLRNTPELTFLHDQSIAYGVNMTRLIDEVTKDLHDDAEEE